MRVKRIILTGGGSAGHVTPNIALIPELTKLNWTIDYIGTHFGIERELIGSSIPYHPISAGKLRRYFDVRNFTDPFRVAKGVIDASFILRKIKPDIVFSKGGFVSLPVSVAAKLQGIPVILHESDFTPGLANKLALPFATHLCLTFPETIDHVPKEKATITGNPIRKTLFFGDKNRARKMCNFTEEKPVILIIGGSLGAVRINQVIRLGLDKLLHEFQVIHICGKGNLDLSIKASGYCQFEYVSQELPDIFALADLVISRAGANVLFELLALKKPHILIPLSEAASRGDQVLNAASFAKQGFSVVLKEESLTVSELLRTIQHLDHNQADYIKAMEQSKLKDASDAIIQLIEKFSGNW